MLDSSEVTEASFSRGYEMASGALDDGGAAAKFKIGLVTFVLVNHH